jgi:[ribosomal protein S5]-alanine N-acetyltransferase
LNTVIKFGFEELEINRIEAEIMPGNLVSEKVLDKLNFRKEGLLREWMLWNGKHYDMIMYSLIKD